MKVSPCTTNYQKRPAFGTLYHSPMFDTLSRYNTDELIDYKKAAKSLDRYSNQVGFNAYIQPVKITDPWYGQGDILVAYKVKGKGSDKRYPERFYSYEEFRANFPEIMEDAEINISRAAKRLASAASSEQYRKNIDNEGGQNV